MCLGYLNMANFLLKRGFFRKSTTDENEFLAYLLLFKPLFFLYSKKMDKFLYQIDPYHDLNHKRN